MVNSKVVKALVDTGCSKTVVHSKCISDCLEATKFNEDSYIKAFNNNRVRCGSVDRLLVVVGGVSVVVDGALVVDQLVEGVDIVLGVDVIDKLGGVTVNSGTVSFNSVGVVCLSRESNYDNEVPKTYDEKAQPLNIVDEDFNASFDGQRWVVQWNWKNGHPVQLNNSIGCYNKGLDGHKKVEFEKEVERWISEGILMPWKENVETGILPLMAVEQPTKKKVRPVLDFRELNVNIKCHTGDDIIDVCCETLRKWRRVGENVSIVDLKSAYLQLNIDPNLWQYQLVNYKGKTFCLTRLGFGLNCAPRIMSKILKHVLGMDGRIKEATSSYIDDILVNEDIVSADVVIGHLNKYGLVTKPPEAIDGAAVLGLRLTKVGSDLVFHRNTVIPDVPEALTKRKLFSICGMLLGHYPVAKWLRVATSFIKRAAEGAHWEDYVGDRAMTMVQEVVARVKREDPVEGYWCVPNSKHCTVWTDASKIAVGVVMEVEGRIIEDAAWLRKKDDANHINVAELEAVLKGVNLALKWGASSLTLKIDSATVVAWVEGVLSGEKRIHTKGAAEMLIKRRLGNLKELVDEFSLKIHVSFTPSEKNRADELTRVPKKWLVERNNREEDNLVCLCENLSEKVRLMHDNHHMGVDRTHFLVKKVIPSVSKDDVRNIVRSCTRCQSIDPAPVTHTAGELNVDSDWCRLAIDVTHYRGLPYLSMVDCGPGRFAIWRVLKSENAQSIVSELENVFVERGPVSELLMDNSTSFRSQAVADLATRWNVQLAFRAAYRPSGNGIVERHHRTIKAIAERGMISPMMAVYWYNSTPRTGQDEGSVPQLAVYRYTWRYPLVKPEGAGTAPDDSSGTVEMGDEVWVKPHPVRCTSKWDVGTVTKVNSTNNIEVDGMPRHILDIRPVVQPPSQMSVEATEQGQTADTRPGRNRKPPVWMNDYIT